MFLQNFNTRCLTYSLNTLFQWFSTLFLDVIMLTTPLNYSIVTEEKCFNFFVLNFLVFLQWKQAKSFKNFVFRGLFKWLNRRILSRSLPHNAILNDIIVRVLRVGIINYIRTGSQETFTSKLFLAYKSFSSKSKICPI